MKCAVVKTRSYTNGQVKAIESVEIRELTPVAAENLSEVATVVALEGIGFGDMTTIYEGREVRQALMTPEQRSYLERRALECARRAAHYDERNGWIS